MTTLTADQATAVIAAYECGLDVGFGAGLRVRGRWLWIGKSIFSLERIYVEDDMLWAECEEGVFGFRIEEDEDE